MSKRSSIQQRLMVVIVVVLCGCAVKHGAIVESNKTAKSTAQSKLDAGVSVAHSGQNQSIEQSTVAEAEIQPVAHGEFDEAGNDLTIASSPDLAPVFANGKGMTLREFEQLALDNNPAVKQLAASAAQASGIQAQVGLRPNPRVGYFADEIGNDDSAGLHGLFVSQTFVRGDKLRWNQAVLSHDANAMRWLVDTQRERVKTDVRVAFYEALAAQRRLELAKEIPLLAEKGVEIARKRLDADGTRPDLLQSEIQLGEVKLLIQQAEFDLEAAWTRLTALTGCPGMRPVPLVGTLDNSHGQRDFEQLYCEIVANSPLLQSARAEVARTRANLQRQRQQPIPNLTGQVGLGRDDASGDDFVNVQMSLPLPINNRNQGNIRAAYADYCEATQNVARIKMQIRGDLAQVIREYQTADATVTQYESTILPRVKESETLISDAYEVGEFDFLRVLTARRSLFDANLQYVNAQKDLATAQAKVDGLLLTGGLSQVPTYDGDDGLRGQALSNQ